MNSLRFWFTDSTSPELFRVEFCHHLLAEEVLAVRGKTGGAQRANASFQWTTAVRAFALLAIRSRLEGSTAFLEGGRGSLAASLDYAIARRTNWLVEVLGNDQKGRPLLRRAFSRTNPERKNQGPVIVSFNGSIVPIDSIEICLDGKQIHSEEALSELAGKIERDALLRKVTVAKTPIRQQNTSDLLSPANFESATWPALLRNLIFDETSKMLNSADIFSPTTLKKSLRALKQHPTVAKLSGSSDFASSIDLALPSSWRLGLAEDHYLRTHLAADSPLRIALPAAGPAASCIFTYLKHVKGYNLELDFCYPHAIEIAQRILRGQFEQQPDACVLGIAPASQLLGRQEKVPYHLLMMLPKNSQRVIAGAGKSTGRPKKSLSFDRGDYFLLKDDPSNPQFYFDDLVMHGEINPRQVTLNHMEPDEVLSLFHDADENTRAILFFPHYHLNAQLNGSRFLDKEPRAGLKEMFLFVHERVYRSEHLARCLDIAIRDAWLTLRGNTALQYKMIDLLVSNELYRKYMYRACGLHNFASFENAHITSPAQVELLNH